MTSNSKQIHSDTQSQIIPLPQIHTHEGFHVLRDDLIPGGTKRRILVNLLKEIPYKEVIYATDPYGHGQLALAYSCLAHNKKVILFMPKLEPDKTPKVLSDTLKFSNVSMHTISNVTTQFEVFKYAEDYTNESSDRYLIPIGFNTLAFLKGLKELALSLPIEPSNVWVLAGSGLLAQALRLAWPNANINVVNMGHPHVKIVGADKIYNTPEKPSEPSRLCPPFPSASYYDAKLWQFVRLHGKKGDFIWNVA